MARRKKLTSVALSTAKARLAGLSSIDAKLDLGKGLSVKAFTEATGKLETDIGDYNTLLATLDGKLNAIQKQEKAMSTLSSRALTRIAADFGKESDEYEKVGGTRPSETKKPVRKAATVG